jgi:rare lipoprotein A (peptidoglycan hydrolase)
VLAAAAIVGGALAVTEAASIALTPGTALAQTPAGTATPAAPRAQTPTGIATPGTAPAQTPACAERLEATYYHPSLVGEPMANGQPYDPRNPRLASSNRHRLGTVLLLRRADGSAAVEVEVMDRGSADLGLDLSEAAFQRLGPLQEGRIPVCVQVVR